MSTGRAEHRSFGGGMGTNHLATWPDIPIVNTEIPMPPITGPASATRVSSTTPQDDTNTYPVTSGETLSSIAEKLGTSVDALKEANPSWKSRGADTVLLGGQLAIPQARPASAGTPAAAPAATTEEAPVARAPADPGTRVAGRTRDLGVRARLENALPRKEAPSLDAIRNEHAVMEVNSKGPAAAHVNQRLRELGYAAPEGDEFTEATRNRVSQFQREHNIDHNGKVGATTLEALDTAKPGVHLNVPYYSQFDSRVPEHGNAACFRASRKMANEAGATVAGADIRTASESGNTLNISHAGSERGRAYIDQQLRAGHPVVVGVDHGRHPSPNADNVTDHYVCVTGSGVDEKGRKYYSFHDPAASVGSTRGMDSDPRNRFYIDEKTGGLYKPAVSNSGYVHDMRYDVSAVLGNT